MDARFCASVPRQDNRLFPWHLWKLSISVHFCHIVVNPRTESQGKVSADTEGQSSCPWPGEPGERLHVGPGIPLMSPGVCGCYPPSARTGCLRLIFLPHIGRWPFLQGALVSSAEESHLRTRVPSAAVLVGTDSAAISRFSSKHSFPLVLLIQTQDCRTFFNLRFPV